MLALLRNWSALALRLAAIALCVTLTGCPMVLQSDVRLSRQTLFGPDPAKSQIVYGIDASRGQLTISLERIEPAISDNGRCGNAQAVSPKTSSGTTYFIFDAPPGTYRASNAAEPGVDFLFPAGKQVYIGDYVYADELVVAAGQPAEVAAWKRPIAFSRNLEAAKTALGKRGVALELAEMKQGDPQYFNGFICEPH